MFSSEVFQGPTLSSLIASQPLATFIQKTGNWISIQNSEKPTRNTVGMTTVLTQVQKGGQDALNLKKIQLKNKRARLWWFGG